ncbi:uncharacterized protein LOC111870815 isoform X2 [Cryptotermes secundus]|uniref:uncharacterized protein LOC111870815 isoform X2 n=1 Tax=Cryptotermes secundus TaxID=105785 RepID=UPI000CD7CBE7|nr:uncharacterized protein LOC111870815 isoform X2 [Cryptotermes secundus]
MTYLIIGGVVILVAAVLITFLLWYIELTGEECAQRCARNNVPRATVINQQVAFPPAPLLQFSNQQPPPLYPYHLLQAQAIYPSTGPPPPYSAVMEDPPVLPREHTASEQKIYTAK